MQCNSCKNDVKPENVKVRECVYTISGEQITIKRELCPRCYAKYEALEALGKKG